MLEPTYPMLGVSASPLSNLLCKAGLMAAADTSVAAVAARYAWVRSMIVMPKKWTGTSEKQAVDLQL